MKFREEGRHALESEKRVLFCVPRIQLVQDLTI